MFRFKDYTTLLEGKADDLRQEFQAMPSHSHLVDLDNPTLVKFGQGLKKMSDVPQNIGDVRQTLDAFNKHGPKLAGNLKDFSQHPSFTHVQQALQPHIEKAALKAQKKQAGVAGEETIHDDGQGTVVKEIHTPEAASQPKYCDGTAWCVSRQGVSGEKHYRSYQNNRGTDKNGKARMFVIHTPDNEMYAYHEGENHEDTPGRVRNRQDEAVPIQDLMQKYPQISQAKELHKTINGNEFAPEKEINSPEDVSEILDDKRSNLNSVEKTLQSPHFGPEHMDKLLNHPKSSPQTIIRAFESPHFGPEHVKTLLNHEMLGSESHQAENDYSPYYNFAGSVINSKHFKPEHLDEIINDEYKHHLLPHVHPDNITSAHIDKLIDLPKHFNGLARLIRNEPEALESHHIDKILSLQGGPGDLSHELLRTNIVKHPKFSEKHFNDILDDPSKQHMIPYVSNKITSTHIDKLLDFSSPESNYGLSRVIRENPSVLQPHHIDKILDMKGGGYDLFLNPIKDPNKRKEMEVKNSVDSLHKAVLNHPLFSEKHIDKAINNHMLSNDTQYSYAFAHSIFKQKSKNDKEFFDKIKDNPNLTQDNKKSVAKYDPKGIRHIDGVRVGRIFGK